MKKDELIFDDGNVYKGEVNKKTLAHGKGIFTRADGTSFQETLKMDNL